MLFLLALPVLWLVYRYLSRRCELPAELAHLDEHYTPVQKLITTPANDNGLARTMWARRR